MAFADDTSNKFLNGIVLDSKHSTTRIKEHETKSSHISAAESFIRHDRSKTIEELINREQNLARLRNVRKNQELVKRIIEWILCIGRQGIAYRGSCESTKYFNDLSVNHGNLLEILMTASKHDEVLKAHLENCGKYSADDDRERKGPRGRGSRVTFLSKTTFNKLMDEIGSAIKRKIVEEVIESGWYSLMVDSTQDIVGHEQCSVVVKYINSATFKVEERVIGLLRLNGEGYLNAIVSYLQNLGIDPLLMIGCSFDGASSMRSDDVGLQDRLKKINEDLVYTWCYAHKLNLSVATGVSCVLAAKNLFGLLQSTHNFCSDSYKRVIQWEKCAAELKGQKKHIKFQNFGQTRWYSHERSLTKIFGSYSDTATDVYLALLQFLFNVKTSTSFDSKATFEASALLDNWTKMEAILTAFTFLKIFDIIKPAAKYLQTKGLNMMAALTMIQSAIKDIKAMRDSFEDLNDKAVFFAKAINGELEKTDMDVYVNEAISTVRVRRVKRLPGELARDEPILNDLQKYRVNQFLVICDTVYQSLCQRFCSDENKELIQEMSYFHPDNFDDIVNVKALKLPFLARVIRVDSNILVGELTHFANFANFFTL